MAFKVIERENSVSCRQIYLSLFVIDIRFKFFLVILAILAIVWIFVDSQSSMAVLRTIFTVLVLLRSFKFQEKWQCSAPFFKVSIRLLQHLNSLEIFFDHFNNVRF
jgi:hypothetical protein